MRDQEDEGGGFGGACAITDGPVAWRPAVDVDRVFAGLAAVVDAFPVTRAGARVKADRG
ncbi:MAG TPA: hypothetical protein VNO31_33875 [Umezawaea sp.]|nr:hypothetical protein [Umezawaea sp.]